MSGKSSETRGLAGAAAVKRGNSPPFAALAAASNDAHSSVAAAFSAVVMSCQCSGQTFAGRDELAYPRTNRPSMTVPDGTKKMPVGG